MKMMRTVTTCAIVLVSVQLLVSAALADGRARVYRTNGKPLEGNVRELPDGSVEVEVMDGVFMVVKKHQITSIVPLDDAMSSDAESGAPGSVSAVTRVRPEIGDDEIHAIISGIEVEIDESAIRATPEEILAPLPLDGDSIEEMLQKAGVRRQPGVPWEDHDNVLIQDHFVMVYTSDPEPARKLMSRVEAIYRWKVKFLEMMNLSGVRPGHKMEVFYFGTYDEFMAAGASPGAIGFYQPDENRSYFFDFRTFPPMARRLERAKDPRVPWRERQRMRNEAERESRMQDMEVIQHEVGHHLDFNLGVFPRDGLSRMWDYASPAVPRWLIEGTTMMFEVPPSGQGGSLGVMNHNRLNQVRSRFAGGPPAVWQWRQLLFLNTEMAWHGAMGWSTYDSYGLGWAMVYYLWSEHREGYAQYITRINERDPREGMTDVELAREFEDIFGEVDEDWIKKFYDFLDSRQLKPRLLY
jgi:sRNA-binding regulator protein Hfq